jgi:hypothetical protein
MPNILVSLYFFPDEPIGTALWASLKVVKLFDDAKEISDSRQRNMLLHRLRILCNGNLRVHMPDTVKREAGKVYCIHLEQYRIVGFFDASYRDFIAVDYFVKKKQRNDKRMTTIYEKAEQIREAGTWQKLK